jgi:hypothetical protein
MKNKTLYLWDLANTLFLEEWDKKTGFENYDKYVESLGHDLKTIKPLDYEKFQERPYRDGLFKLKIADGFQEVLSWTKNNEAFTTGNKEQIDWRAENFLGRGFLDIRPYLRKINTTFDFANTNKKDEKIIKSLFEKKIKEGHNEIIYTDDKLENCLLFQGVGKKIKNLRLRVYHLKNDNLGIRKKDSYWEIGNLYDEETQDVI